MRLCRQGRTRAGNEDLRGVKQDLAILYDLSDGARAGMTCATKRVQLTYLVVGMDILRMKCWAEEGRRLHGSKINVMTLKRAYMITLFELLQSSTWRKT